MKLLSLISRVSNTGVSVQEPTGVGEITGTGAGQEWLFAEAVKAERGGRIGVGGNERKRGQLNGADIGRGQRQHEGDDGDNMIQCRQCG